MIKKIGNIFHQKQAYTNVLKVNFLYWFKVVYIVLTSIKNVKSHFNLFYRRFKSN